MNGSPPHRMTEIYRRYAGSVARRAHAMLGDQDAAQDMVHEVFEILVAQPAMIDDIGIFAAWLYTTTTRRCLNRIRDDKNRKRLLDRSHSSDAVPGGSPSVPWHATLEQQALVATLLQRMPAKFAEVAIYHFLDDMTHEEIAQVLGCSRRQVGNLVRKALAHAQKEVLDGHAHP